MRGLKIALLILFLLASTSLFIIFGLSDSGEPTPEPTEPPITEEIPTDEPTEELPTEEFPTDEPEDDGFKLEISDSNLLF